jgi:hypothetical protein
MRKLCALTEENAGKEQKIDMYFFVNAENLAACSFRAKSFVKNEFQVLLFNKNNFE